MSKDLHICDLLEIYGPVLTGKQALFSEMYFFDDLSLSEIAENEGISRQGVQDIIKRAERQLLYLEEKLKIYEKSIRQSEIIEEIDSAIKEKDIDKISNLVLNFKKTI